MKIFQYIGNAILAGLSLLPVSCSKDTESLPVSPPTLENIIWIDMEKAGNVKPGDTFEVFLPDGKEESLRYIGRDIENRTLKFVKPETNSAVTRDVLYDAKGSATLVINGATHGIQMNSDGSFELDYDARTVAAWYTAQCSKAGN